MDNATPRLPLREQLYLLAHDPDRDFRPRIHLPTLDIGLAGALLVDLVLGRHIHLDPDLTRLTISNRYDHTRPVDPIVDQALAHLRRPVQPPLRHQVTGLADGLSERIQGALVAAGRLRRVTRFYRRTLLRLTDSRALACTMGAAREAVTGSGKPSLQADALCAIVRVLHLHEALYLGSVGNVEPALATIATRLTQLTTIANSERSYAAIPIIITTIDTLVGDIAVAVYR